MGGEELIQPLGADQTLGHHFVLNGAHLSVQIDGLFVAVFEQVFQIPFEPQMFSIQHGWVDINKDLFQIVLINRMQP